MPDRPLFLIVFPVTATFWEPASTLTPRSVVAARVLSDLRPSIVLLATTAPNRYLFPLVATPPIWIASSAKVTPNPRITFPVTEIFRIVPASVAETTSQVRNALPASVTVLSATDIPVTLARLWMRVSTLLWSTALKRLLWTFQL